MTIGGVAQSVAQEEDHDWWRRAKRRRIASGGNQSQPERRPTHDLGTMLEGPSDDDEDECEVRNDTCMTPYAC